MSCNRFLFDFRLPCRQLALAASFAFTYTATTPLIAAAHGVIGNRVFLGPIVGNDAFPDNSLDFVMNRSDYEFSLISGFEKLLSENSSVLVTTGWRRITPGVGERGAEGSSDLPVYYRRCLYTSVSHVLKLTLSPFLVMPTGDRQIADQGYTHLGGEALLAKGFGDLPESPFLKYLRPFAIQAEAGYAGRVQGPANSDVFGNLELEYSLEYLDRFVERLDIGSPLVELVPYIQFNYAQSLIDSRLTTKPDFRLTPGVAYLGDYCKLSVGPQVALNGAAHSGDRVSVLVLFEISYDEIFPVLGWKPF